MLSPLALVDVANDFVGEKENRKQLFKGYPKQVLYFVSQHKRKIRDKTRGIVHNCSDLTCTKKYALTEGPKRGRGGGKLMWATRSAPPVIFCLLRACQAKAILYFLLHSV